MATGSRPLKITECLKVIKNMFTKPKYEHLNITMQAYLKLMSYIHLVGDNEITGLGRIKDDTIIDFKIPKQVVDGTTADATDDEMLELLREIPIEEMSEWELDWHSHVNMQVFISGTDEENYELMSMARGNKQFPIMVVNKKGEFCFKNFIHAGKTPDISLTLLKEDLSDEVMEGIYAEAKKDVEEKVHEKVRIIEATNWRGFNNFNRNFGSKKKEKEKEEEIIEADYAIEPESKRFCRYCGVELITPDEIDEGLCEDCMTWGYNRQMGFVEW